MSMNVNFVELSMLILTAVDVLVVTGILVWDVYHGRESLKIARKSHRLYEDFFTEREKWYAARNKRKSAPSATEIQEPFTVVGVEAALTQTGTPGAEETLKPNVEHEGVIFTNGGSQSSLIMGESAPVAESGEESSLQLTILTESMEDTEDTEAGDTHVSTVEVPSTNGL